MRTDKGTLLSLRAVPLGTALPPFQSLVHLQLLLVVVEKPSGIVSLSRRSLASLLVVTLPFILAPPTSVEDEKQTRRETRTTREEKKTSGLGEKRDAKKSERGRQTEERRDERSARKERNDKRRTERRQRLRTHGERREEEARQMTRAGKERTCKVRRGDGRQGPIRGLFQKLRKTKSKQTPQSLSGFESATQR
uniref:Uncharacterized protein n=1 Tax=Toxoplasma gondii COUG TaxID=1074873 RepID=A0A2G8Y7L9_TOXGO|nr:hypothetical protein TGCOUG_392250 [Toxoplasma gondii COUG]